MNSLLPRKLPRLAILVIAGVSLAGNGLMGASSLTDSDMELTEAKLALDSSQRSNANLRHQLDLARHQLATLTDSLVIANSEGEVFKRETSDLKLRLEALGLDSASPDKALLEQRLLKAVSDLKITQDEKDKLTDQLIRLNEAVLRYVKGASSVDGDARMALETELRASTQALGVAGAPGAQAASTPVSTLTDCRVISVKDDLALIVANVGRRQGVKIGMPFQVWHDGKNIGIVRVVDVREGISGAVFQSLDPSQRVKVGDDLRVDARM
jgi:hypothetical protein